jgi:GLPGLI family protein
MKTILIALTCLILPSKCLFAQHARIITSGSIEYEKSVNTFAVIRKTLGANLQGITQQAFEQYQKTQPQFKIFKSTLTFDNNKSLYTPIAGDNISNNFFGELPLAGQKNTIYTDFSSGTAIKQKIFFEETFLIRDSLRKIKWKLTDETREIAGYTCRRANAIILDSVYVVAFYTNEIHVSGGPESITGLPGMILEVALPHDNVIWRAIKVNDIEIPPNTIIPAKKGKQLTSEQFIITLNQVLKNITTGKKAALMKLDYLL